LHGANRLASNSLIEALVFGARAATDIRAQTNEIPSGRSAIPRAPVLREPEALPQALRQAMSRGAGIERDADGLQETMRAVAHVESVTSDPAIRNATAAAKLILAAALSRQESIGAHFRTDHPDRSAKPKRSFLTLAGAEQVAQACGAPAHETVSGAP
jgi:L-aspartate oxidase